MATTTVIGALLVVCGIVYMAMAAIFRGRMTDRHSSSPGDGAGPTLEPRRAGLGFLGAKANWPGVLIAAIGLVLLLIPAM